MLMLWCASTTQPTKTLYTASSNARHGHRDLDSLNLIGMIRRQGTKDGACDFIDYPACIRIQAGLHAFPIGISQLVACEVFAALLFEILYGPQVDSEQWGI